MEVKLAPVCFLGF